MIYEIIKKLDANMKFETVSATCKQTAKALRKQPIAEQAQHITLKAECKKAHQ